MQNKNKPKKQRILLSLTLLASIFTQLTAPVAVLATEEIADPEAEETPATDIAEEDIKLGEDGTPADPMGEGAEKQIGEPDEDNLEEEPEEDINILSTAGTGEMNSEEDGESELDNEDGEDEVEGEEEPEETDLDGEEVQLFQVEEEYEEPFDLALMHMNDTHARVESYTRMITAINTFRAENSEALLLHAGDVFSGTLYFNEFQGEADLALMNLMGIDAMTFGNHEFDLGASDDGHAALSDFVANAEFPFLGTNVDFSNDQFLAPYQTNASLVENPRDGAIYDSIVLDVDGEQVGVFSLTTEDTANIASPVDVTFSNYIETAKEAVAELEAAGINKIVALTHIGFDTAPSVGNDLVLAESVEGIDIIVGGHSHTALATPRVVNEDEDAPTVIVQAGANAEYLGTLNVQFNETGEIINHTGELLAVESFEEDPEAVSELAIYKAAIEDLNNEEIGAVAVRDLENPRHGEGDEISVRANETPLGNLITDAMLYKAREKFPEIDFSVHNGGGIRAPISAGPITIGEVIQVLPFANNPVIAELTGEEIKDLFELSVQEAPEENGGFLHVSGLRLYYDSTREPGDRVVGLFIIRDGGELEEVEMGETYLVTTNGFTGMGGDGLTPFEVAFNEGRVRDIGEIDWQQLRDYMVEEQYLNGTVDPVVEGRIVDLLGEPLPGPDEETPDEETPDEEKPDEETPDEETPGATDPDSKDPGDDDFDDGESTEDKEKPEKEKEKQLPRTGTAMNSVLPFATGATLVISGLGVEAFRKKKSKK